MEQQPWTNVLNHVLALKFPADLVWKLTFDLGDYDSSEVVVTSGPSDC